MQHYYLTLSTNYATFDGKLLNNILDKTHKKVFQNVDMNSHTNNSYF